MHDHDTEPSNTSANPWLSDVRATRRVVLKGGIAAALTILAAPAAQALAGTGTPTTTRRPSSRPTRAKAPGPMSFTPVPAGTRADTITVPPGYSWQVLAPWGEAINPGGPGFTPGSANVAARQNLQVGMHHDGMHFFPIRNSSTNGLLVMNHEYIDQNLLMGYPASGTRPAMTNEQLALALAAHGVSVLAIRRNRARQWSIAKSGYNRRVTGDTPMTMSGPVTVDHPLLATGAPLRGTLNNCAHGYTPWGTYLACEENFNGYFGATAAFTPNALQARYGITKDGFGYNWHTAPSSRFDLSTNPNEVNRFGWVVEINPWDPTSTPVKRTALGRFKHEGATVHVTKGDRIAVYMGDDENGDYLYKFVSSASYRVLRKAGKSPLDEGTLFVARFNDDGTGTWLPLVHGTGPLTVANGWVDQADVLIRTRQAADAVGATKLDRPEWTSVDPGNGVVYLALTNGAGGRGATSGSRGGTKGNPYGQVLAFFENDGDHAAMSFVWDVFVFAGDPTKTDIPNTSVSDDNRFGSPDGLWVDQMRRVWIQTDVSNSTQNKNFYDRIGNNQMLVANPDTREIKRFLSGPEGCEITGVITTPDMRTLFINVQHPGESPQVSTFPFGDIPRSCTVVIRKNDGGIIGS
jgi:secreted PhoX family phosphatase